MRPDPIRERETPVRRHASPNRPTAGSAYRPLRCRGEVVLPSALALDVAQQLDVDPDVEHWRCRVPFGDEGLIADFATYGARGEELLILRSAVSDIDDRTSLPRCARFVSASDVDPVRGENARLILPYARWRVSLDDRIRLLAVLDEEGSVSLGECLAIFRNTARPIAAVASLALARVVDLELDTPLGSRTRVIRRAD